MEDKTIKLPSGREAVLRGYISGRDQMNMRRVMFAGGNFDKVNPVSAQEAYTGLIESLIISYGGEEKGAFDQLMDAQTQDYDAVFEAVVAMHSVDTEKKEKATAQSSKG